MHASCDSLYQYIEDLRQHLYIESSRQYIIEESGEKSEDVTLSGKKDYKTTTRIMVDQGRGEELRTRILATKDTLLSSVLGQDRDSIADLLPLSVEYNEEEAEQRGKKNWSSYLFDHVPLIAVNTILKKFQTDIRDSEKLIRNYWIAHHPDTLLQK